MTSGRVEAGGLALAYEDSGAGPAAVFVHGTATDRSLWRETLEALGDGQRAIAYDRRAYGDSGAPEPYGGTTVEEQAEDAVGLIGALGAAPAVLCGHGLGAVVCLDLVRRHPALTRGAVLIEPPLHSLSAAGAEAMAALREQIEQGARDGGPAGAVDGFLLETAGARALELLGPARVAAARAAPRAFAADLAAAPSWEFGRRELRRVELPLVVVCGSHSAPLWREIAAGLDSMLPSARLELIDAGHLSPVEAPREIAAAVADLSAPRAGA